MRTVDMLHESDLRIVRVLYDNWKKEKNGELKFDAESCNLETILSEAGMTKPQAGPHLKNLQEFEFIEYDKDTVKILPSGINYALGQFDKMIH